MQDFWFSIHDQKEDTINGCKVYKADLHTHTIFSDGKVTPEWLAPAGKSLKVEMASGGGFAARISRKL